MLPALPPGSRVLVSWFRKPRAGDVVVLCISDKVFVKRLVKISSDGYLVEGDNADDSLDSRAFGAVLHDAIIGRVVLRY